MSSATNAMFEQSHGPRAVVREQVSTTGTQMDFGVRGGYVNMERSLPETGTTEFLCTVVLSGLEAGEENVRITNPTVRTQCRSVPNFSVAVPKLLELCGEQTRHCSAAAIAITTPLT